FDLCLPTFDFRPSSLDRPLRGRPLLYFIIVAGSVAASMALPPIQRPALAVADGWREYALLDAGHGMKQERWGAYTLVRPDPQIIWPRRAGPDWREWDGYYHRSERGGGKWEFRRRLPASWKLHYTPLDLTFRIQPTSFKH